MSSRRAQLWVFEDMYYSVNGSIQHLRRHEQARTEKRFQLGDVILLRRTGPGNSASAWRYWLWVETPEYPAFKCFTNRCPHADSSDYVNNYLDTNHARPERTVTLPLCQTNAHANAYAFYADVIDALLHRDLSVDLYLHPADTWFRAQYCQELTALEREITRRWRFVTVRFDLNSERSFVRDLYDVHFNWSDSDSVFETWRSSDAGVALAVRKENPAFPCTDLPSKAWCVQDFLAQYATLCKTSAAAYIIIRQPLSRVAQDVYDNHTLFYREGLLPREWSLYRCMYLMPHHRNRRRYVYHYLFAGGPRENYSEAQIRGRFTAFFAPMASYAAYSTYAITIHAVPDQMHANNLLGCVHFGTRSNAPNSAPYAQRLMHPLPGAGFHSPRIYYVGPKVSQQWRGTCRRIFNYALALTDLVLEDGCRLPPYVLLAIIDLFTDCMHASELQKVGVIGAVIYSKRCLLHARILRRNPDRVGRARRILLEE